MFKVRNKKASLALAIVFVMILVLPVGSAFAATDYSSLSAPRFKADTPNANLGAIIIQIDPMIDGTHQARVELGDDFDVNAVTVTYATYDGGSLTIDNDNDNAVEAHVSVTEVSDGDNGFMLTIDTVGDGTLQDVSIIVDLSKVDIADGTEAGAIEATIESICGQFADGEVIIGYVINGAVTVSMRDDPTFSEDGANCIIRVKESIARMLNGDDELKIILPCSFEWGTFSDTGDTDGDGDTDGKKLIYGNGLIDDNLVVIPSGDELVIKTDGSESTAACAFDITVGLEVYSEDLAEYGNVVATITGDYDVTPNQITVGKYSETEAPTTPADLSVSSKTSSSVNLTWDVSTDNIGVDHYLIGMKQGIATWMQVGTTIANSFIMTGLSSSTTYVFRVKAVDEAGNESDWADELSVTTNSSGGGGTSGGGGSTPSATTASKDIEAATGGTVICEGITVEIPADTLPDNAKISISKLTQSKTNEIVPEGLRVKLGSDIYEISTTGSRNFGEQTIAIRIPYNPSRIVEGQQAVIQYYDEIAANWVALDSTVEKDPVTGKWYAVTHVNHLTKFAVFCTQLQPKAKKVIIFLKPSQLTATVDGKPYSLDATPFVDTKACLTLVPIRFFSETLGAKVDWTAGTNQVIIEDEAKEIVLVIGSRDTTVNGMIQATDVAPQVTENRTFVPLRFVSETLGATVDYDISTKLITITR